METNFIPSFTQLDALRDLGRQKGLHNMGNTPEVIQEAEKYLDQTQESLRSNPLLLRYMQDRPTRIVRMRLSILGIPNPGTHSLNALQHSSQ